MRLIDHRLRLSERELFKLTKYSEKLLEEEKIREPENPFDGDDWIEVQLQNRHFNLNIFTYEWDEIEVIACVVYECFQNLDGTTKGNWSTDPSRFVKIWAKPLGSKA